MFLLVWPGENGPPQIMTSQSSRVSGGDLNGSSQLIGNHKREDVCVSCHGDQIMGFFKRPLVCRDALVSGAIGQSEEVHKRGPPPLQKQVVSDCMSPLRL